MTIYEVQSLINFIFPLLASLGYLIRIVIGLKRQDYSKFRILLPLFLLASMGMSAIYLLNVTGWWAILEPDYQEYSKMYIRPYFTYLGSLLLLASWIHPDLHPFIEKVRRMPWTLWHGLIFKKK